MLIEHEVMSHAETAFILRQLLGPGLAWNYVLADMRRGRNPVGGLFLTPVCHIHDGRQWTPAYRTADIARFAKAVREADPEMKGGVKHKTFGVELDLEDGLIWKMRRFKSKPVPKH